MDDTFRKRLKRLRMDAGKTQDDMAKALKVKRSTYGEYERGKIMPPVDKIEQMADVLLVSPHYLLGWDTPVVEENTAASGMADKIKQLREERRKTLEEMAAEVGISAATLSQYENGVRKIPYTAVKKLAKYFGIELALLYGMEFGVGDGAKEELRESMYRLKMAEMWNREVGKALFSDSELAELISFAKYLVYKRSQ